MTGDIDRTVERAMDEAINLAFPEARWGIMLRDVPLAQVATNNFAMGAQFLSYWFFEPCGDPMQMLRMIQQDKPRILGAYFPERAPQCRIETYAMEDHYSLYMSAEELLQFSRDVQRIHAMNVAGPPA